MLAPYPTEIKSQLVEIAAAIPAVLAAAAAAYFFMAWRKVETAASSLRTEAAQAQEKLAAMEREMQYRAEQLPSQFENLAAKVLEANSRKLSESSEKNLGQLLNPLKEKLSEFQKKVEDTYNNESRERHTLKNEIANIVATHEKMRTETQNLTNALKGSNKVQGNWGEHVLAMLLESCGLREGDEFITQGRDMKLQGEDGQRLQPDVLVRQPDNKHIVIDSKVSLTHYEQVVNAETPEAREQALALFLASVRAHIKGLAAKDYPRAKTASGDELGSPDFVLMFMPVEGAYMLALQSDASLHGFGSSQNVMMVSPATLLPILRTVSGIWKQAHQNKNTQEIARQGGNLYDKFVTFVESMEKIGKSLGDTRRTYDEAMNRLSTGHGSLISRTEKLRELGVKNSKTLPEKLLAEATEAARLEEVS